MIDYLIILGVLGHLVWLRWLWLGFFPKSGFVVEVRHSAVFGWYWRIVAANNVVLTESLETYANKRNALKTARKVAGNHMRVEVV